ncbi:hypothetical protein E2C01_009113 [Portunus trituberculatus]|uniref:Uncharacterized protein n=1 Tax=Portunus trituberculatus TaxID=210409 RepID=A0A5B7D3R1_PORTR|nr:hypothetical protein [Portunus trituberculatus]
MQPAARAGPQLNMPPRGGPPGSMPPHMMGGMPPHMGRGGPMGPPSGSMMRGEWPVIPRFHSQVPLEADPTEVPPPWSSSHSSPPLVTCRGSLSPSLTIALPLYSHHVEVEDISRLLPETCTSMLSSPLSSVAVVGVLSSHPDQGHSSSPPSTVLFLRTAGGPSFQFASRDMHLNALQSCK